MTETVTKTDTHTLTNMGSKFWGPSKPAEKVMLFTGVASHGAEYLTIVTINLH